MVYHSVRMLEGSLSIGAVKQQGNKQGCWQVMYLTTYLLIPIPIPIYSAAVASVFKLTMLVDGVSIIKCAVQHQPLVCH